MARIPPPRRPRAGRGPTCDLTASQEKQRDRKPLQANSSCLDASSSSETSPAEPQNRGSLQDPPGLWGPATTEERRHKRPQRPWCQLTARQTTPIPAKQRRAGTREAGFISLRLAAGTCSEACHTMVPVRGTQWARPAPLCQPHSQAPMPSSAPQVLWSEPHRGHGWSATHLLTHSSLHVSLAGLCCEDSSRTKGGGLHKGPWINTMAAGSSTGAQHGHSWGPRFC